MAKAPKQAITPQRHQDFPEWYQQLVRVAEMAENSEVRGAMIIRPWGYALWQKMQQILDQMFADTGHQNAYFPLFIPLSHLQKEAEHVEGFAKECAVVTHHRLELQEGKLVPAGELTEPLIVRPTSETIIGSVYSKWVQSYRDLPLLLNQWANVVRWEMRPRLFLRTTEFLWQEGHTAHETAEEALEETKKMWEVYATFCRDYLAIPVIKGEKTESERFPGALQTYTIEAMVQDHKAIQAGTSHFLGQNFAKASNITFQSREGTTEHAWTTSWGVSTRLIGTLLMAHGDDDGAILPPKIAPQQIAIIPFIPKEELRSEILTAAENIKQALQEQTYGDEKLRVTIDQRDLNGSSKNWDWIKRGAPLRLELGPRDLAEGKVMVARRDHPVGTKEALPLTTLPERLPQLLEEIQSSLLERAQQFQTEHTRQIDSKEEFYAFFTPQNRHKPEIHGGFALTHWNGSAAVEEMLKKELQVTIRCIPETETPEPGICPFTGEPSKQRVLFAKSY